MKKRDTLAGLVLVTVLALGALAIGVITYAHAEELGCDFSQLIAHFNRPESEQPQASGDQCGQSNRGYTIDYNLSWQAIEFHIHGSLDFFIQIRITKQGNKRK